MAEDQIADESQALAEYWDLLRAPVFWGAGVPRGDRRLVLVLPGLFGNDFYLRPLRTWLGRIGYRPAMSTIRFNAGCSDRLAGQVEQAFAAKLKAHRGDVAIIGHSRGGMLGKALVTRIGKRCTHFIALGSPLGAVLRHGKTGLAAAVAASSGSSSNASTPVASPVAQAGRRAQRVLDPDCNPPWCDCRYVRDLLAPMPAITKVTAIFSNEDPIVPPNASRIDGAANITVTGTHSGLVFNRTVYTHIADALK